MYIYIYVICVTDMYVYMYIYRNIHMCSKWINWISKSQRRFQPRATPSPSFDRLQLVDSKTRYVVFMWFIGKYMGIIWEL